MTTGKSSGPGTLKSYILPNFRALLVQVIKLKFIFFFILSTPFPSPWKTILHTCLSFAPNSVSVTDTCFFFFLFLYKDFSFFFSALIFFYGNGFKIEAKTFELLLHYFSFLIKSLTRCHKLQYFHFILYSFQKRRVQTLLNRKGYEGNNREGIHQSIIIIV